MMLYLDDDIVGGRLLALLRRAGHDVQIPASLGFSVETTKSIFVMPSGWAVSA
jgi:hypothetical protein